MPVRRCTENGRPGYKCGNQGKCYTYSPKDASGRLAAKKSAIKQCLAEGEPPGKAEAMDLDYYINECDECKEEESEHDDTN